MNDSNRGHAPIDRVCHRPRRRGGILLQGSIVSTPTLANEISIVGIPAVRIRAILGKTGGRSDTIRRPYFGQRIIQPPLQGQDDVTSAIGVRYTRSPSACGDPAQRIRRFVQTGVVQAEVGVRVKIGKNNVRDFQRGL